MRTSECFETQDVYSNQVKGSGRSVLLYYVCILAVPLVVHFSFE